jgi:hypothetical protein
MDAPEEHDRVRLACLACHLNDELDPGKPAPMCSVPLAQRPRSQDCVACHMRRTRVFDVAEVEIHDHWIRRRPGAPSVAAPLRMPESASGDWRVFAWPDARSPSYAQDPCSTAAVI